MSSISYLPRDCLTEIDLRRASMKVWIDVLTPKHALFFEPLYRDLARDGHELLLTTRTYREAEEALELKRLPFHVVGEHGGATRYGKLLASGRRVVKLAQLIENWSPDTAVSFSSPNATLAASGDENETAVSGLQFSISCASFTTLRPLASSLP